jgi:hypothetical protein
MVTAEMVDGVLRTFRLTRAQYKVDTGMKPWYVSQPPQPQGALGPGLPGRDQPEDNRHGRDHRHVREAILGGLRGRSVYDSCGTRSSVPAARTVSACGAGGYKVLDAFFDKVSGGDRTCCGLGRRLIRPFRQGSRPFLSRRARSGVSWHGQDAVGATPEFHTSIACCGCVTLRRQAGD